MPEFRGEVEASMGSIDHTCFEDSRARVGCQPSIRIELLRIMVLLPFHLHS